MAKPKQRKRSGPAKKAPARPTATPTVPKQRREDRIAAQRAAERRRSLLVRGGIAGALVAVVAAIAVFTQSRRAEQQGAIAEMTSGSCTHDRRSDPTSPAPNNHVPNPTFEVDPPAGGNHDPSASPPGIFTGSSVPSDGRIVHALEHGYVAIWYRPDISAGDRKALEGIAETYDRDVLLVPRPSLGRPVAATSWGHRLLCGEVEPEALDAFVVEFRNKGPEKVPH